MDLEARYVVSEEQASLRCHHDHGKVTSDVLVYSVTTKRA